MATLSRLLTDSPFFAGMRPIQLERLSFCALHRAFPAGTRMCDEGDPADRFWIIREGLVCLDTRLADGTVTELETLGPGAVVGWSWLCPYRWPFGAVAVTPTSTVEMDAAAVRRLCAGNAEIGYELSRRSMKVVEDRLAASQARLAAVAVGTGGT